MTDPLQTRRRFSVLTPRGGFRSDLTIIRLGDEAFHGETGDRIAQLLIVPFAAPPVFTSLTISTGCGAPCT